MKHVDLDRNGYVLIDIQGDQVQGDYYYISSIDVQGAEEAFELGLTTADAANHLVKTDAASPNKPNQEIPAPEAPFTTGVIEGLAQAKFSSFNVSLNRFNEGDLIEDLSHPDSSTQAKVIAEIIQINQPDVLLLNEFDYDEEGVAINSFRTNYLEVSQNGKQPAVYPYVYIAPSNTGIQSGFDFNNDDNIGDANDAYGFGFFPGQFGMALLSKYPIDEANIRTFQEFLWKDMPGALLPDDPTTTAADDWYSAEELDVFRLSSKSHWDVPVNVDGKIIHILASHPTPPVFDGDEDRNGRRNHDEIRFWKDYINGEDYMYDDNGQTGGLATGEGFVIMGDLNADPFDGDATNNPAALLLDDPLVNTSITPSSEGGPAAALRQGLNNNDHIGDPAFDTADFAEENNGGPGNIRADYVLPSANLTIVEADVFWPDTSDANFALVGDFPFPSSDHRMVSVDLEFETPVVSSAFLQVIHNAKSQTIDAYINGDLALDNFAYRTATPYIELPANTPLNLGLALPNSTSAEEALINQTVTLEADKTYILVAHGTFDDDEYPITLGVYDQGRMTASADGNVDLLFFHGSPDAPEVDIVAGGAPVFDNVAYGEFAADYVSVPAATYQLDVTPAEDNATIVASYEAGFGFWKNNTAVVFATEFLGDGSFQPWVALSNGGTYPLFPPNEALVAPKINAPQEPLEYVGNRDIMIMSLYPNPGSEYNNLRFFLNHGGFLNLDIVDMRGRVVRQIASEWRDAGAYKSAQILSDLPAGPYMYRIDLDGSLVTRKFVVTH